MKIIYLAWGSLLWNPKYLKLKTDWKKTNFKLPLNFSRISDKGKGRLTLVIDQENGDLNNIFYAVSKTTNLNNAISNLKNRENTITNNIGYLQINSNKKRSKNLTSYQEKIIIDFLEENQYDAAVFTDLKTNFNTYSKQEFSKNSALEYLTSKNTKISTKILEYIILSKLYGNISTKIGNYLIQNKICS